MVASASARKPPKRLENFRQEPDETRHLPGEKRHQQKHHEHHQYQEGDRDDGRGQGSGEPPTFQAVAEGIQEIGDRHPGDERQEDIAQEIKPDKKDDQAEEPETQLPFRGHFFSFLTRQIPGHGRSRCILRIPFFVGQGLAAPDPDVGRTRCHRQHGHDILAEGQQMGKVLPKGRLRRQRPPAPGPRS